MNAKELIKKLTGRKNPEASAVHQPDEYDDPNLWELDGQIVERIIEQIKRRFIEERVLGYTHPKTGEKFAPVSPEEAQRRWEATGMEGYMRSHPYNAVFNRRVGLWRRKKQIT